jgi:hypothetical protein
MQRFKTFKPRRIKSGAGSFLPRVAGEDDRRVGTIGTIGTLGTR